MSVPAAAQQRYSVEFSMVPEAGQPLQLSGLALGLGHRGRDPESPTWRIKEYTLNHIGDP